jgi:putative sterol carrier protein
MSAFIDGVVEQLNAKLSGGFDGSVKFAVEGEGTILINEDGASASDGDADCTITAEADVFKALFDGDLDPTSAFMTGKVKLDGDMGTAMKLQSIFS